MPTGLDGNPDPVRTAARQAVLDEVAQHLLAARRRIDAPVLLVGIDGESGSGKSTFADEVADRLQAEGVATIRSTTDSFHNPRVVRLPPGVDPAISYYERSHDLAAIRTMLLDPLTAGAGRFRRAAFDEPTDSPVDATDEEVVPGTVLLFDGLFLHRPELRDVWHVSVLLEARQRTEHRVVSFALGGCPPAGPEALLHLTARWARVRRYVEGWSHYVERCRPEALATIVVDNGDIEAPSFRRV